MGALTDDHHLITNTAFMHPAPHCTLIVSLPVHMRGVERIASQSEDGVEQPETPFQIARRDHDRSLNQARHRFIDARNVAVQHCRAPLWSYSIGYFSPHCVRIESIVRTTPSVSSSGMTWLSLRPARRQRMASSASN